MNTVCQLCGRKKDGSSWVTDIPIDPTEIENQIANLDIALIDLIPEEKSLLQFIGKKDEMCPMCQGLMDGIRTSDDRVELEERINSKVEELEEKVEVTINGEE